MFLNSTANSKMEAVNNEVLKILPVFKGSPPIYSLLTDKDFSSPNTSETISEIPAKALVNIPLRPCVSR